MQRSLSHLLLLKLFILLSLADLGLTAWMLLRHPQWVSESNPVANWWLANLGLGGMAAFKVLTVLVVWYVSWRLLTSRRWLSHGVLIVGCLTVLAVVAYSSSLARNLSSASEDMSQVEELSQTLDVKWAKLHAHTTLVKRVCRELGRNQVTLKEAVELVEQSEHSQDPSWVAQMKLSYHSDCLAVCLAKSMLWQLRTGTAAVSEEVIKQLEYEYRTEFADMDPGGDSRTDPVRPS